MFIYYDNICYNCVTQCITIFLGLPKHLYIKNNYCYIVNITRDIFY